MRRFFILLSLVLWSWSATAQVRFAVYYNDLAALVAAPVSGTADIQRVAVVKYTGVTGDIDTGGVYYYDSASVLATNAITVLKPTNANGRWIRGNAPGGGSGGLTGTPAWINVTDPLYAATTAAGNDDTAAVQSAANAAAAATHGAVLYFPPGTYDININVGITFTSEANITILGDGPGSVIRRMTGGPIDARLFTFQSCTNIVIQNMGFDANGVTQFGGTVFYSCKRVWITKNRYFDSNKLAPGASDRYSFIFGAGGVNHEDISITDNIIEDLQLEVDHATRVQILDNVSYRTVRTVAIGAASIEDNQTISDYVIARNTIIDPDVSAGAIGVIIDPNTTTNCVFRRFTIANNSIFNRTNTGSDRAILIGTTALVATTNNIFEDFNIVDNYVFYNSAVVNTPDAAIFANSTATANFNFRRLSVRNNTVIGGGQAQIGIDVRLAVDSDISDNTVEGTTAAGISVNEPLRSTITGNRLINVAVLGYSFGSSLGTNHFANNVLAGTIPATEFFLNVAASDQYIANRTTSLDVSTNFTALGHIATGNPTNAFFASSSAGNSRIIGKLMLGSAGTPGYQLDVALDQRIWGVAGVGRLVFENLAAPLRRYQLGEAGGHAADEWVISDSTAAQSRLILRTNGTVEIYAGLTVTSNLTVTSPVSPDASVFRIDSGVGSFGTINSASINDLAYSKLLAGQNNNNLTNLNLFIAGSVKELQGFSRSTTYSWDLDGNRSQFLELTNNTTVSFANVPTLTNVAEFFSLTISNTGAFTLAFTEPANGRWPAGEPVIGAGAKLLVTAFWDGYELVLSSSADGLTLSHFNTNQFTTNAATWPIALKDGVILTNPVVVGTMTGGGGSQTPWTTNIDAATFSLTNAGTGVFTNVTVNGGTVTASNPAVNISQTWNNAGVTMTAMRLNVTDTASAAASKLLDVGTGGGTYATKFNVTKAGDVNMGQVLQFLTASSAYVAPASAQPLFLGNNGSSRLVVRAGTMTFTDAEDLTFMREGAAIAQLGADAAGVTDQTFKGPDRITSDGVGGNLTIAGGRNRGASAGGSIIFQTSPVAGAGVAGTLATALTIDSAGTALHATGKAIGIASGTNQRAGNATLISGAVTVTNTTVTANTLVLHARKTAGGTLGMATTYTISAGNSFTLTSDNVLDTSTFSYVLFEVP